CALRSCLISSNHACATFGMITKQIIVYISYLF
ncbi:MAG: hypothetical protein ACI9FW_002355, partial [Flavobacterium sp.]